MKTFLLGFALALVCTSSSAQEERTTFENLSVITTANGMAVQLSWTRGDEDIAFFVVERSTDGVDFKQCAVVFLSDDPEFVDYKFRDKISSASSGWLYRIGMVNPQKRICYLPVRKLASADRL